MCAYRSSQLPLGSTLRRTTSIVTKSISRSRSANHRVGQVAEQRSFSVEIACKFSAVFSSTLIPQLTTLFLCVANSSPVIGKCILIALARSHWRKPWLPRRLNIKLSMSPSVRPLQSGCRADCLDWHISWLGCTKHVGRCIGAFTGESVPVCCSMSAAST